MNPESCSAPGGGHNLPAQTLDPFAGDGGDGEHFLGGFGDALEIGLVAG